MKSQLNTALCIAAFAVSAFSAADTENKSSDAGRRLREIAFSITLHQYERVQMEVFEAKLKLDLLDTEEQMTQEERAKKAESLEKRVMILRQRAEALRNTALKLGTDGIPAIAPDREKVELQELRRAEATALDAAKAQLKDQLSELLNQYSSEHPKVKQLQEQIPQLEAKAK